MKHFHPIVKRKLELENRIARLIKTFEKERKVTITSIQIVHASGATLDFEDTVLVNFVEK